jgi:ribonuclease HI
LKIYRKHNVAFSWVKGHANNIENERCDFLAVEASEKTRLEKDLWYEKLKTGSSLF